MAPEYIAGGGLARRLLIRLALAPQSLVVCVNEQIRMALDSCGYDRGKTLLMPAFLFDTKEEKELDARIERELERFRPLLSLVAFFRQEYGVELMIEALGRLAERFPQAGCAVMGSGNGEDRLRQLAAERGVTDRLVWLGDLEHGECLSVMKRSDLFVRPTYTDGDSVSVREAVELRVPVVASNVGHRPAGVLLFQPGDVEDLAAKCEAALLGVAPSQQKDQAVSNGFLTLIEAYKQIGRDRIKEITTKAQRAEKFFVSFLSLWFFFL
jgi:glycosyltransferase involved in cell wall biosynthesis